MNQQFLRMQQLAGVSSIVVENQQIIEGIKFYIENVEKYTFLNEIKLGDFLRKITPQQKYFFKLLGSLKATLPSDGLKALATALEYIKNNPNLTPDEIKKQLSSLSEAEDEESTEGLAPLRKFLTKSTLGKTLRNAIIGIATSALIVPTIQNMFAAISKAPSDVVTTITNADNIEPDSKESTISYQDASKVGVSLDGKSLETVENEKNTDIKVIPFEFGDGNTPTPEGQKILDDYVANLKLELESGTITGDVNISPYGFASNTGDNSEKPDDDSENPLSIQRGEYVSNYLKSKLGDEIGSVKINYNTPQQGDYTEQELEGKKGDNGAVGVLKTQFDIEKTEKKIDPIKFHDEYRPLYAEYGNEKSEKEPQPKDKEETSPTQTSTPPTPTDSEVERDVKVLSDLNRNSQIALVLSRTNPNFSLFKAIGLDTVVNLSDGDINNIADKGLYKDKTVPDTAKKLANVVRISRKSPNTFINAYAKLTGIKSGDSRAKASITQKGVTGKSASAPIKETNLKLITLLNEAAIDTLLSSLGKISDIKTQAYLTKLINTMYIGDQGKEVLDPNSHIDPNFKTEYDKIKSPLASKEKGERYVYLGKLQPDVSRIIQIINKDTQLKNYLNKIDKDTELADFILALFLYKDGKGAKLFDPKFAPDANKVKSAIFGLNFKIKDTIKEVDDEDKRKPEEKQIDVKKAYERIEQNTTLKNLLNKINTIDEFHQLVLQGILPFINPIFKKNTDNLKKAIAKAANTSSIYTKLLNQPNK